MILVALRNQISSNFNLSELKDLCFDLKINYENIAGETLNDKARELVAYCNRRGLLQSLVEQCTLSRPNAEWVFDGDFDLQENDEPIVKEFSESIKSQMAEFRKTVKALTEDQYEIIKSLRGERRVSIAGCAGSGKTLVAAEKAIRLDSAGVRTLIMCHNPGLAEYLKGLTFGTGVVVFDFSSWINYVLEKQPNIESIWTTFSNYQEPVSEDIDQARATLVKTQFKYEAIIVDEAQDFREEWWNIIETALVENGILYAFHDDNQALLPNRLVPVFNELPYSLSKNCRNAGKIFKIVKCFHPQAPEVSMFLADKGVVKHTAFEAQEELKTIRSAVQEALEQFSPNEITVLTTEHPPLSNSILNGLEIQEKMFFNWQREIVKVADQILHFPRLSLHSANMPKLFGLAEELELNLSNSVNPTEEDLEYISKYFSYVLKVLRIKSHRLMPISPKWRFDESGQFVITASPVVDPIYMAFYFCSPKWSEDLPKVNLYRLTNYNNGSQTEAAWNDINFFDIPSFKGLESTAVILFIRSARDNLSTNLYVGMSRAVY
jgi:hypothetical protein